MPHHLAALTLILLIGMVLTRVWLMNRQGIRAMKFGNLDKKDFLIPPFALFYCYIIFAESLPLPAVSSQEFFRSDFSAWIGVALCTGGLGLLIWSVISFGRSFRVGIDTDRPDRLITSGIFAVRRNPIYVAFAAVLLGQFLIFPNWILLVYMAAATWLFHRQILREEEFLKEHYGAEYANYCRQVRRYL